MLMHAFKTVYGRCCFTLLIPLWFLLQSFIHLWFVFIFLIIMAVNIVNNCINVYLIKNNNIYYAYAITYEAIYEINVKKPEKCNFLVEMNQHCHRTFYETMQDSKKFRSHVLKLPKVPCFKVAVNLRPEFIDFIGAGYLQTMVNEKLICDTAMSYLSTLGGAFSALGDNFAHCAEKAGEISCKQYQIALRSQDEPLLARCRLYMALSLIQQGSFKLAKKMIFQQSEIAKKFKDFRLINMCKGVWSKLQYSKRINNNHMIAHSF